MFATSKDSIRVRKLKRFKIPSQVLTTCVGNKNFNEIHRAFLMIRFVAFNHHLSLTRRRCFYGDFDLGINNFRRIKTRVAACDRKHVSSCFHSSVFLADSRRRLEIFNPNDSH